MPGTEWSSNRGELARTTRFFRETLKPIQKKCHQFMDTFLCHNHRWIQNFKLAYVKKSTWQIAYRVAVKASAS